MSLDNAKYKHLVIDGRGHLLGRLAAVIAKQVLSGQRVVSNQISLSFSLSLGKICFSPTNKQVVVRAEQIEISGPFYRNKGMVSHFGFAFLC